MSLKDKYAIVGVGYTPQGHIPDRTLVSFYAEACANAIKDAGLKREDIDGFIAYRYFTPLPNEPDVSPYLIAQYLGLSPKVMMQDANCSRAQLHYAVGCLEAGLCNYVLIAYACNRMFYSLEDVSISITTPWVGMTMGDNGVFGHFGGAGRYAMAARRAMHIYGTGPEVWREIAVGQRKWADLNPRALMCNQPLTYEDYDNADYVEEPFRPYDYFLRTDGGRAYIVTSVERARDLRHPPVVIMGMGQHNPSAFAHDYEACYKGGPTGAKIAGEIALKMAGITLDDIDAVEIYDCWTYTADITLQDYGFYGPGEGKDWFKGGTITPGGRLPMNTSGGLLSEAYHMGLTPLTEGVMQIMGRCEDRQLGPKTNTKEPEIILCNDEGGVLDTHATYILRRL